MRMASRKNQHGQVQSQTFRLQASTDSAGYCHKSRRRRQTHHHQLITETGDIELPELTDSSADEEINITLNRSTLEMLRNLSKEITESENKQPPCGESSGKT